MKRLLAPSASLSARLAFGLSARRGLRPAADAAITFGSVEKRLGELPSAVEDRDYFNAPSAMDIDEPVVAAYRVYLTSMKTEAGANES